MTEEKKCAVCDKTESEALARGDIFTEEISVEDEYILSLISSHIKPNSFFCTACRFKVANTLSGGKIDHAISKIDALCDYIFSSGFLFGLDGPMIVQACLNVAMTGMLSMPIELKLKALKATEKVVRVAIQGAEQSMIIDNKKRDDTNLN